MKRIYICAPYSGDIETNKRKALSYALLVKKTGSLPFCPHLYFDAFCDEETERERILDYCREEVRRSDEVWLFGGDFADGCDITDGKHNEIMAAMEMGIKIRNQAAPTTHETESNLLTDVHFKGLNPEAFIENLLEKMRGVAK